MVSACLSLIQSLVRPVTRFLLIAGLASLWVFIEWARSLFMISWCPLWYSVGKTCYSPTCSFFWRMDCFFFSNFLQSMLTLLLSSPFGAKEEESTKWLLFITCPEFTCAWLSFWSCCPPYFQIARHHEIAKIRVGVCQPYLKNKWSPENISSHKRTLIEQTKLLASLSPDLIVWPEASTPYPVNLDRAWVEKLSKDIDIPILAGAIIREEDLSYNSVVMIDPKEGLESEWYTRTLVPFGEYVPFSFVPGLSRLVGPVGNFIPERNLFISS